MDRTREEALFEPRPSRAEMKQQALRMVRRATARLEKNERGRAAAMRWAADSGASLREIAEVAGMSHMGVKAILGRIRELRSEYDELAERLRAVPELDEAKALSARMHEIQAELGELSPPATEPLPNRAI